MVSLKVPKIRSFLEYANFVILFMLYVIAVEGIEEDHLNKKELLFIIYALGRLRSTSWGYITDSSVFFGQAGYYSRTWTER